MRIDLIGQEIDAQILGKACFYFLLFVFFAFDMVRGLKTGNALLLYTRVNRSEHPILFWYGILLSGILSIVGIALFIYFLFSH